MMGLLQASDEAGAVEQIRRLESAASTDAPVEPYGLEPTPEGVDTASSRAVSRTETLYAANFYEGLAASYNTGNLDRRLVRSSFQAVMPQTLEAAWWWIHYQREGRRAAARVPIVRTGEIDTYSEWERMARVVSRSRHAMDAQLPNKPGLNDAVRALCLPRQSGTAASDAEWQAAKDLSVAVGKLLSTPGGADRLADDLEAAHLPAHPGPAIPERTLLIPRCREDLPEPGMIAHRVYKLGALVELSGPSWMRATGGRVADRDPRVASHKRLHALAIGLDRAIRWRELHGTLAIVQAAEQEVAASADSPDAVPPVASRVGFSGGYCARSSHVAGVTSSLALVARRVRAGDSRAPGSRSDGRPLRSAITRRAVAGRPPVSASQSRISFA